MNGRFTMKKYVVLDFGGVLAKPTSGNWFVTPEIIRTVKKEKVKDLMEAASSYNEIISRPLRTEDEEYEMFYEYYQELFQKINYSVPDTLLKHFAADTTYSSEKCTFYDGIKEELAMLESEYTLLLLSDNWPCGMRILKEGNLIQYFKRIYISSIYGTVKKDGTFFEYPIHDFNIKENEAIFIDDNETLLEVGETYGFQGMLMDRSEKVKTSKYKILKNLKGIERA